MEHSKKSPYLKVDASVAGKIPLFVLLKIAPVMARCTGLFHMTQHYFVDHSNGYIIFHNKTNSKI